MNYVIHSIEGNRQRLDGGAMFGNVPRAMWEAWAPPDERHRIDLACRGFLIHDRQRGRRILLETGIGLFFEPRLRDRFGVLESEHVLLASLARRGVEPGQIDVVVLSHLHFDHAGGLLDAWREGQDPGGVFPRAQLVVGQRAWDRANHPHLRDRASFIPAIMEQLHAAERDGRMEFVPDGGASETLGPDFRFHLSHGHTPGLLLTELETRAGSVVFCGDLIPGRPWIHLPVTMGYDRFPELLIEEKQALLQRCIERQTWLLLTHDSACAACRVQQDKRGRFGAAQEQVSLEGLEL